MFERIQRHPFEVKAELRTSLVLTYAFRPDILKPLLPPGLVLEEFAGYGYLAIAMVEADNLRPSGWPRIFGQNFFLAGYRLFCRLPGSQGTGKRGLKILRSDTNQRRMTFFGNLLTHYNYRTSNVSVIETPDIYEVDIKTTQGEADLHVAARLNYEPPSPPQGSPFASWREARRFAGPLPYTFDYESGSHSLILIQGVRRKWHPVPVDVTVKTNTFVDQVQFRRARPILANAFLVRSIPYTWRRGIVHPLPEVTP